METAAHVAEVINAIGVFILIGGLVVKGYQNSKKVKVKITNCFGWRIKVRLSGTEEWIEIKDYLDGNAERKNMKQSHEFEFRGSVFGDSNHWCEVWLDNKEAPLDQEPKKFLIYGDGIPKRQYVSCRIHGGYVLYDGNTPCLWPDPWLVPNETERTEDKQQYTKLVGKIIDGEPITTVILPKKSDISNSTLTNTATAKSDTTNTNAGPSELLSTQGWTVNNLKTREIINSQY